MEESSLASTEFRSLKKAVEHITKTFHQRKQSFKESSRDSFSDLGPLLKKDAKTLLSYSSPQLLDKKLQEVKTDTRTSKAYLCIHIESNPSKPQAAGNCTYPSNKRPSYTTSSCSHQLFAPVSPSKQSSHPGIKLKIKENSFIPKDKISNVANGRLLRSSLEKQPSQALKELMEKKRPKIIEKQSVKSVVHFFKDKEKVKFVADKSALKNISMAEGLGNSMLFSSMKDFHQGSKIPPSQGFPVDIKRASTKKLSTDQVKIEGLGHSRELLKEDIFESMKWNKKITQIKEGVSMASTIDRHASLLMKARQHLNKTHKESSVGSSPKTYLTSPVGPLGMHHF